MEAFVIKLIVLVVLTALFAATVWVTPWLFTRGGDPKTTLDPKGRSGDS